jgi:hypothetical protein
MTYVARNFPKKVIKLRKALRGLVGTLCNALGLGGELQFYKRRLCE